MPHLARVPADWQAYHKFNSNCRRTLFWEEDCLEIASWSDLSDGDTSADDTLVDFNMVVGDSICSSGRKHAIAGIQYKACTVLDMSHSPVVKLCRSTFRGVRYIWHSRHEQYYKQARLPNAPVLVARDWKYDSSESLLNPDCNTNGVFPVVTILVKTEAEATGRLTGDLLCSLGSQVHVFLDAL